MNTTLPEVLEKNWGRRGRKPPDFVHDRSRPLLVIDDGAKVPDAVERPPDLLTGNLCGIHLRAPHQSGQLVKLVSFPAARAVIEKGDSHPPKLAARTLRSPQIVSDRVVNLGWGGIRH